MTGRMRILGIVLAVFGLAFMAGGAYTFLRTQEGARPAGVQRGAGHQAQLQRAERLVDRGEPAQAQEILALLKDWGYPIVAGDLNPNDHS